MAKPSQTRASGDRSPLIHGDLVDCVAINAQGEWSRGYRGREYGVPSPIEQNKKHIDVLDAVLRSGAITLPRRIFTMHPELLSLVLISNNAVVKRPRAKIEGINTVIRAERLKGEVDATWDERIRTAARRLVSSETIERIGRELAALHRPIAVDWAANFGLANVPETSPSSPVPEAPAPGVIRGAPADPSGKPCDRCAGPTTFAEVAFCRFNKPRFKGGTYCRPCQAIVAART
jgi:hypothetical protein